MRFSTIVFYIHTKRRVFNSNCSFVYAIVYAKRINLEYSTIKYNSDILIDFEHILFLSLINMYIPLQCGKFKLFYNDFIKYLSEEPTCIAYWQKHTKVSTKELIQSLSLVRASCKEAKLFEFQYKVLHNFVNVNRNLFKWGLINSPKYIYCENEDSILHYLFRCVNVNNFIEQIVDYINSYIEHEITYSENEYIFGIRDKAVNHVFIIIKYTICLLKNLG